MKIENTFTIHRPISEAWDILLDIPSVAPCMPGVVLTDVKDGGQFGLVGKVKLGPVQLVMHGEAQLIESDPVTRVAKLTGKARDEKGRGTALSTVVFQLKDRDASSTTVDVVTDVDLAGTIAQYGRGTGLIHAAATQIIAQFASNLERKLEAERAVGAAGSGPATPSPVRAEGTPISGVSLLLQALWLLIRRQFARK